MDESTTHEIIDIPVPSEQSEVGALCADATIEIEEVKKDAHFSVDYRRC
jgi:hypothetical protein